MKNKTNTTKNKAKSCNAKIKTPDVNWQITDGCNKYIDIGQGLSLLLNTDSYEIVQNKKLKFQNIINNNDLKISACGAAPILNALIVANNEYDKSYVFQHNSKTKINADDIIDVNKIKTPSIVNLFTIGVAKSAIIVNQNHIKPGDCIYIAGDAIVNTKIFAATIQEAFNTGEIVAIRNVSKCIVDTVSNIAAKSKKGILIFADRIPACKDGNIKDVLNSTVDNQVIFVVNTGHERMIEKLFYQSGIKLYCIGEVANDNQIAFVNGDDVVLKINIDKIKIPDDNSRKLPVEKANTNSISFDEDIIPVPKDLSIVARKVIQACSAESKPFMQVIEVENCRKTIIGGFKHSVLNNEYDIAGEVKSLIVQNALAVSCTGADPVALSVTLNLSEKQNESVVNINGIFDGLIMSTNLTGLELKNISKNIFSKATEDVLKLPSLFYGIMGILEDKGNLINKDFKQKGDVIYLLGESNNALNSSEYLRSVHCVPKSATHLIDHVKIQEMLHLMSGLTNSRLIQSANVVSKGGLFLSMYQCCIVNKLGFDITTDCEIRPDAFLFGESPGRVIVTVNNENETDFIDFLIDTNIKFNLLGHVTKGAIRIDDELFGYISEEKGAVKQ